MKYARTRSIAAAIVCLATLTGCSTPATVSDQQTGEAAANPAQPAAADSRETAPRVVQPVSEQQYQPAPPAEKLMSAAGSSHRKAPSTAATDTLLPHPPGYFRTESYSPLAENSFLNSSNDPLSTFSIDVDTASYANIRRFIHGGALPPVGAVRIEEMINYFTYAYEEPKTQPLSVNVEIGPCPWRPENQLARIGLQAKTLPAHMLPPSNLVFLIDVSGSMNSPNKLPLLKRSMLMLVNEMKAQDKIALVVYAGRDRVVLPPTPGDQKETIRKAIAALASGGSTHASSGITTAYELARQGFIPGGNNRIILASDGDFNIGVTSRGELERLISDKRQTGVNLTVLGFGMGNFKDDTMEILADRGNGNYAYIDSLLEAKKVLLKERASTLYALAHDVKIQVEFNPAVVGGYRLIGYENRVLADEDFRDDKKDAGEIGLGHSVTALYEMIPAGAENIPEVDGLKYQKPPIINPSDEVMTVRVRYKETATEKSKLFTQPVTSGTDVLEETSDDYRFAAAVAGFGMLLKDSPHKGDVTFGKIVEIAKKSRGADDEGYRAEFIRLVETAELLHAQGPGGTAATPESAFTNLPINYRLK